MNDQNEQKALAIVPQRVVSLGVVQAAQAIAPLAKMFGHSEEQATIAMLTGYELGLGMMASLRFVDVIKTKGGLRPALRSQAMAALINRSGVLSTFTREDHADTEGPSGCTVTMVRRDRPLRHTTTFNRDDANRAGLSSKSNWQAYPRAMYYNRALAECARAVCPDVIMGLYTVEETEAMDADWSVVPDPQPQKPAEPVVQQVEIKAGTGMGDVTAAGFTPGDVIAALSDPVLNEQGVTKMPDSHEQWDIMLRHLQFKQAAELDEVVKDAPEVEYTGGIKPDAQSADEIPQGDVTESEEEKTDE